LDFADNYFIDKLYVHHIGIVHSVHTSDIIKDILNGKINPAGITEIILEKCNCNSTQWIPVFYNSEDFDRNYISLRREFLWKCKNQY